MALLETNPVALQIPQECGEPVRRSPTLLLAERGTWLRTVQRLRRSASFNTSRDQVCRVIYESCQPHMCLSAGVCVCPLFFFSPPRKASTKKTVQTNDARLPFSPPFLSFAIFNRVCLSIFDSLSLSVSPYLSSLHPALSVNFVRFIAPPTPPEPHQFQPIYIPVSPPNPHPAHLSPSL